MSAERSFPATFAALPPAWLALPMGREEKGGNFAQVPLRDNRLSRSHLQHCLIFAAIEPTLGPWAVLGEGCSSARDSTIGIRALSFLPKSFRLNPFRQPPEGALRLSPPVRHPMKGRYTG